MAKRKILEGNYRNLVTVVKEETHAEIKEIAQAEETNVSTIVRRFIREGIQQYKHQH